MDRRDFLRTASGVAAAGAATTAAGTAAAGGPAGQLALQEEDEDEAGDDDAGNGGDLPGAGETETVTVGPGGDLVYDPEELFVLPGTTVEFVWDSDNHNLNVTSGPDDGWEGYDDLEDTGFEYEHTFEVEGTYEYVCDPHVGAGMEAEIVVTEDVPDEGAGGGVEEVDPADMGIGLQKHFVGIATFFATFLTLVFTFYVLKYGESANTSSPNRK